MKKTEGQILVCMSLVLAVRISRYFQSMVIVLSGLWGGGGTGDYFRSSQGEGLHEVHPGKVASLSQIPTIISTHTSA